MANEKIVASNDFIYIKDGKSSEVGYFQMHDNGLTIRLGNNLNKKRGYIDIVDTEENISCIYGGYNDKEDKTLKTLAFKTDYIYIVGSDKNGEDCYTLATFLFDKTSNITELSLGGHNANSGQLSLYGSFAEKISLIPKQIQMKAEGTGLLEGTKRKSLYIDGCEGICLNNSWSFMKQTNNNRYKIVFPEDFDYYPNNQTTYGINYENYNYISSALYFAKSKTQGHPAAMWWGGVLMLTPKVQYGENLPSQAFQNQIFYQII